MKQENKEIYSTRMIHGITSIFDFKYFYKKKLDYKKYKINIQVLL